MARINLIMLLLLLLSALGTVASNHRARKLFTELERSQAHMRELEVEWGQLQLEQSTWATHARVEKIARDKLHMKQPAAADVMAIEAAP